MNYVEEYENMLERLKEISKRCIPSEGLTEDEVKKLHGRKIRIEKMIEETEYDLFLEKNNLPNDFGMDDDEDEKGLEDWYFEEDEPEF